MCEADSRWSQNADGEEFQRCHHLSRHRCSKWSEASSSIWQRKCTILNVMSYVAHRWIWKGARGLKRRKSVEGAKADLAPIQQPEQGSAIEEAEEVCNTSIQALEQQPPPSFFAFHCCCMHLACLAFTSLWLTSPNAVLVLHIQFLPLKLQRSLPHYSIFDDNIAMEFKSMIDL